MTPTSSRRVMSAWSTRLCQDLWFSAEMFSSINSKSSTCSDFVRQIFFQRAHSDVAAKCGPFNIAQIEKKTDDQLTHVNHFFPIIIPNVSIHDLGTVG